MTDKDRTSPETETLLRELRLVASAGDVPPRGHTSLAKRAADEIERLCGLAPTPGLREKALEAAALDFVAKVERGAARSTASYAAFKSALAQGPDTSTLQTNRERE